jgi:hypothetical protein
MLLQSFLIPISVALVSAVIAYILQQIRTNKEKKSQEYQALIEKLAEITVKITNINFSDDKATEDQIKQECINLFYKIAATNNNTKVQTIMGGLINFIIENIYLNKNNSDKNETLKEIYTHLQNLITEISKEFNKNTQPDNNIKKIIESIYPMDSVDQERTE